MRGLKPSIKNKIARNLIKVYSTMVSSVATIKETLNETRKITNPKSQYDGTSAKLEGRFPKKPKIPTSQQQYSTRFSTVLLVVPSRQSPRAGLTCFGCHQSGHHMVGGPLKGQRGNPAVKCRNNHRLEGHLLVTNMVRLVML